METTDQLVVLPCPFCGKIPTVSHGKVKCENDKCLVKPRIRAWYVGDSKAIQDWNKRDD